MIYDDNETKQRRRTYLQFPVVHLFKFSHSVCKNGRKMWLNHFSLEPCGHHCRHASESGQWCQSVSQGQVMTNDGKLEWRLPAARSPGQQRIGGKKPTEKMAVKHTRKHRHTNFQTQRPSFYKGEWIAKREIHNAAVLKSHFSSFLLFATYDHC